MKKILAATIMVLLAVIFYACKKEDLSQLGLLSKGDWYLSKSESRINGVYVKDSSAVNPCESDDGWRFSADYNFKYIVNNKCDSTETDLEGIWAFRENETKIAMIVDGDNYDFKIVDLNKNNLILEYREYLFGNTYDTSRYTFSH